MRLIIPNVEIWEQGNTLEDMWKHIARCTRVCYQSTPKENGETDEEFVKRVILRNISDMNTLSCNFEKLHGAMLEHGTVYLDLDNTNTTVRETYITFFKNNPYSRCRGIYEANDFAMPSHICITTNLRVIYENHLTHLLNKLVHPTDSHIKRVTVSFTTNIGVTREFNRHRVNSPAEESTRYCDYTAGRLQKHNKFALPAWLLDEEHLPYIEVHQFDKLGSYLSDMWEKDDSTLLNEWCDMDFYLAALTFAEWFYQMLRHKGWKPQQAREVLPLATKSQLIHTAFIDDWKHFFALRANGVSGPPHPNAELVAAPLKEEFIKRGLL